jgi:hypothetical protein
MAIVARLGVAEVSEYRVYVFGDDGHVASSRTFVCDNDANAAIWAKQLGDRHDAELWSGDRFVTRLPPAKKGAITHDVVEGRMVPKKP